MIPRVRLGASLVAVGIAVAGIVVLGCASHSPQPSEANVAESDAIKRRLAALPGVVRVDGGYARDVENPGSASFSIGVGSGTDLDEIADKTVEAVWRSRLDPIGAMGVLVGRFDDPRIGVRRHVDFTLDRDELTRRYGPRPVRR